MAPGTTTLTAPDAATNPQINYSATIGSTAPHDYLDPGHYTFFNPGGPDVGAFSGSVDFQGTNLKWINREALQSVKRSDGVTVNWTGGDPASVVIVSGSSTQAPSTPTPPSTLSPAVSFLCYANAADGQFTVPTSITSQLYPTQISANSGSSLYGALSIATSKRVRMQASGVDYLTGLIALTIAQSTEWK
jgi:hypothetical protein